MYSSSFSNLLIFAKNGRDRKKSDLNLQFIAVKNQIGLSGSQKKYDKPDPEQVKSQIDLETFWLQPLKNRHLSKADKKFGPVCK